MPTLTINGYTHFYEESGTGNPLLLLNHGLPDDDSVTMRHMPDLARDFRVIVPDARGHARSEHVREMPPSAWVDDVVGLMDALDLPDSHVFGEGMGTRVALRLAIDHPNRLKTLSLSSPILFLSEEGAAHNKDHPFSPWNATSALKKRFRTFHGDDWEGVVNGYVEKLNSNKFNSYYDLRNLLSNISIPTLIMRGDDIEHIVRVFDHAIQLHRKIPNSRLFIYPNDQNNFVGYDQEFRDVLRRFLLDHT